MHGLDLARAVAMLGMFFAHYGPAAADLAEREQWPFRIVRFNDGRAMPLFVVLSGAGFTFLVRRSPVVPRVLSRAVVLLFVGLWLEGGLVLVILHFYALYFVAGLVVYRLPTRVLLVLAAIVAGAGALSTVYLTRHLPDPYLITGDAWWSALPHLRHPIALLTHLTFTGAYAFFPSFAFFLVGMVLARQDLRSPKRCAELLVLGAAMAVVGYGIGWRTDHHRDGLVLTSTSGWRFLSAAGHSQMPVWVIATTGGALVVVALSLLASRGAPRVTRPFAVAGELALTFYLLHVFVIRRPLRDWPYDLSPSQTIASIVALYLAFVTAANLWRRYFARGPAEAALRAADLVLKDS